jgi:alpha-glucosidase
MIYKLSSPSAMEDVSWIRPGKVAWDWWNANNIYGVDFISGINTETYRYYIDFASRYGIEYIILDEGWYKLGDLASINPDINMEELLAYADQKNVGIILWVVWKTLWDQMDTALDQFERWGVKGIKVDFMQRDDQWMVNYYWKIAEEAAKRHLLVDFHGSYKPAGLHRTWPNVMTREGVRGLEWNKWSDGASPENAVTIPFIRMLAGPVDYTPGAMANATKEQFKPIFDKPMSQGTRCHQLAMYVVFESPLQMLADSPSRYYEEEESMEFLGPVPSVWDETIVLDAKVSDYLLMARRSGDTWYIGAMTDWTAIDLVVDLSFLGEKQYNAVIWKDGINADRFAEDFVKTEQIVTAGDELHIHLAPGGGFVGVLKPCTF